MHAFGEYKLLQEETKTSNNSLTPATALCVTYSITVHIFLCSSFSGLINGLQQTFLPQEVTITVSSVLNVLL